MKTNSTTCSLIAVLALALGSVWMASAVQVTFKVDMSIQDQLGTFTPGVDAVQVAGSFNGWTPGDGVLADPEEDNIYEGTFEITGDIQYKYVYGGEGWEANGVGPDGANDRQLTLPGGDTVLDVVFFNNVNTLPSTRNVTFQLNLSVQEGLGNFDALNDFVQVAGGFNGWSTITSELTQSAGDPDVYDGTFSVAGAVGEAVDYKFVLATFSSGDVWENNDVGPGGAQNRQVVLEAGDQLLPVVYFNNLESAPTAHPVTFQVNMAAQMALGNFAEGANTVGVGGTFNNWGVPDFFPLAADPAEPTIYKGTADIVAGAGSLVSFQYVLDTGAVWEDAVGNRTFNLEESGQTLDPAYWNNVDELGTLTTERTGDQVEASWTPGPMVRLQMGTGPGIAASWTDVPNTQGESNATVTVTTDETYLRLIGP